MNSRKDHSLNDIELLRLTKNLDRTQDLDSVLNTINIETTSLLEAERCTLFIYDPLKEELWSKIAQELEIDVIRLKIGEGIAGQVAQNKAVMNIQDAYDHPDFNQRIDEITGYRTKTLLGSPLLNIEHNLVGVIEVLNKREGIFTERDEKLLTILSKISAIAIEQAQLYEWNKILRQYNEDIINNMSSGLIIIDTTYEVLMMNKVAEKIFEPFKKDLKGKVITDVLPFFKELPEYLDNLTKQGSSHLENIKVTYKDQFRYLNIRSTELKINYDEDYGYIILVDDITERVLLEQENKQQEHLSLIGKMTSSIIHDIKNPMSIIKTYLQIMQRRIQNDKFTHYYSIIDKEIDRLVTMTSDVLNFARGEYRVNLETCRVIDFIDDVTPLIKQLFQEKHIQLNIRIQYEDKVNIDKDKITRLFYNIASNANSAMDKGGTFEIKIYRKQNQLIIHFIDNGKGIPKELHDKIFMPFMTHDKTDGIGLGMAIVKKIVDEHNGDIQVNSDESEVGTEITVILPVAQNEN